MSWRLLGSYVALPTPFSAGEVDYAALERLVDWHVEQGSDGLVAVGTTGEGATLTDYERRSVIERTIERAGRRIPVVAGIGTNNTAQSIELARFAQAAGADAALVVTPYYNKPSQEGIYRHFMTVADCCPLPVMLYNIPGRCGVAIAPETVERLARHPNVRAIKEATGSMDSASEIRQRCGITVLSGDDSLTPSFAAVGAAGVVSVVSNLVPGRVAELCGLLAANDFRGALEVHMALLPLSKGLLSIDVNPVPVKCALASLGLDSGAVRLPLAGASPSAAARIHELVVAAGLAAHAAAHGAARAGAGH